MSRPPGQKQVGSEGVGHVHVEGVAVAVASGEAVQVHKAVLRDGRRSIILPTNAGLVVVPYRKLSLSLLDVGR